METNFPSLQLEVEFCVLSFFAMLPSIPARARAESFYLLTEQILSGQNGVFDGVIETNTGETVGEAGKTLDDATITGGINWYFKTVNVVE